MSKKNRPRGAGNRIRPPRGLLERLEPRLLLASSWQNPVILTDVNDNGQSTAADALAIINRMAASQGDAPYDLPDSREEGEAYYDVTGDQQLSSRDALVVINRIAILNALGMEEVRLDDAQAAPNDSIGLSLVDAVSEKLGEPVGDIASFEVADFSPDGFGVDSSGQVAWTIDPTHAGLQVPVRVLIRRDGATDLEVSWSYHVSSENLVTNGSFETFTPPEGRVQPDARWVTYQGGDAGIEGWTVTANSVDLKVSLWEADEGSNSVDLAGSPGPGGVTQQVDVLEGEQCRLTFALSGNFAHPPDIQELILNVNGQEHRFDFDTTGRSINDMGWVDEMVEFTAVSDSVTLDFRSENTGGGGAVIDNVRLVKI